MSNLDHTQPHRFQVNLGGMIDLLSNHLYSSPRVYIRELLQNAVDAISARRLIDPTHLGQVRLEVFPRHDGAPPTLVIEDDGVGLTEIEIHQFLATIGESSKREELSRRRGTFIGQFGIGLLSCFMVSDEIVLLTRSARDPQAAAVEWRGHPSGTYTVRTLEKDLQPGTRVYLTARMGFQDLLSAETVEALARQFGGLLPIPLELHSGGMVTRLTDRPPWRDPSTTQDLELNLAYGERLLGEKFFDVIPLQMEVGEVEGAAYVLSQRALIGAKPKHRVYLKGMLVSESAEDLLPDWAFFVRCVIDARSLRPTASREELYEDEQLAHVRNALGRALEHYLVDLAASDPKRLQRLISLHYPALKALASENVELLRLFFDWLPFQTSLGEMTGQQIRERGGQVYYTSTVDRFRQISRVATAQSLLVINAGYSYDVEILTRASEIFPETPCVELDPDELGESFQEVSLDERDQIYDFLRWADVILQPFGVQTEARRFEPIDLPVIYLQNESAEFLRSVGKAKDISGDLFSGVLDGISMEMERLSQARLYFNYDNSLIRRVAGVNRRSVQEQVIQMLYIQALLLGQYPLNQREMKLLNQGVLGLIEISLGTATEQEDE